ncbi:hypothetical protein, partial [Klebsiella pneumoniae]|uniref:hypothetical protein n=1 Tax=Klebsiella pneumoniae TaxID=573 RepID=UPI000D74E015
KRAYCLKTQPATGETYPKSDLFNKAVSAPKAEIVAMRKHLGNVEYGMKAIADACRRAGNKTISFRGAKAEFVIG